MSRKRAPLGCLFACGAGAAVSGLLLVSLIRPAAPSDPPGAASATAPPGDVGSQGSQQAKRLLGFQVGDEFQGYELRTIKKVVSDAGPTALLLEFSAGDVGFGVWLVPTQKSDKEAPDSTEKYRVYTGHAWSYRGATPVKPEVLSAAGSEVAKRVRQNEARVPTPPELQ